MGTETGEVMAFEFLKTHEMPVVIRGMQKELNPDTQTIAAYRAELARRNGLEWCVHIQYLQNAAPSILMNCDTQAECEEYIRTHLNERERGCAKVEQLVNLLEQFPDAAVR